MSGSRHEAREAALQALYFSEVGGGTPAEALAAVFAEHRPDVPGGLQAFAATLVAGAAADRASLDGLIASHSAHWRVERLSIVDKLIMRLAIWELQHVPDTPPAVVLSEALELARTFSTEEAVKFVNGVLDAVRRSLVARS
jgi:N utilization substance protein B